MADATSGFGQQDPTDSAGPFNQQVFIILQQLAKVSTLKIVQVKAVDTAAKTVDVQPMVNLLNGDNQSSPHGTIQGLTYWQWQYGKNAIQADPVVEDIGIIVCADRDSSSVIAAKAIANPGSARQLDAQDGIYLGGVLNGDPEQWIKFTDTGMEWHDKNDNVMLSNSTGIVINGVTFNRNGQIAGNLPITGNLQLGGQLLALAGTSYTADITTSGRFHGLDFQIGVGGTLISLSGHWHAALNQQPTPGH